MSGKTLEINITGIVQGVGFRPFLFELATRLGLTGYILNRGNAGVRLLLQGKIEKLEQFTKDLDSKKPDVSFIESIEIASNIIVRIKAIIPFLYLRLLLCFSFEYTKFSSKKIKKFLL